MTIQGVAEKIVHKIMLQFVGNTSDATAQSNEALSNVECKIKNVKLRTVLFSEILRCARLCRATAG